MTGIEIEAGQRLTAGFTGRKYTVTNVGESVVIVRGKRGPLRVDREELKFDIARGKITIEEWR